MADVDGKAKETVAEPTVEELRISVAEEVFGDTAGVPPDPAKETAGVEAVKPETVIEPDPWEGVPPVVRKEVESLRERVGHTDKIEARLKQAESRLGSVLNEMHAAKQAAKAAAAAPSAAQESDATTAAAKAQATWNKWKEEFGDFPELTNAIDARLAAERAELLGKMPNVESFREEFQRQALAEISVAEARSSERLVRFKHPKFVERINSPEFAAWYEEKQRPDSQDPLEVIAILDDFEADMKSKKSTKKIVEERDKRLELSQVTKEGRKLPPVKSEADMSDEELRASIAKEVWTSA